MDITDINLWTISQWPIECHDFPIKLVDWLVGAIGAIDRYVHGSNPQNS